MKEIAKQYFGIGERKLSVPVQVYESWDEVHKEITPAQSLDRFNKNLSIFLNNRVADLAVKTAQEVSKTKPNDKETDVAYLNRVINTEALFTAFQTAITNAVKAKPIRVNAGAYRNGSGPKDVAKAWKDQALSWIKAEVNEKTGKKKDLAALNQALSAALGKTYVPAPGKPADDPANLLALGLLLKEFNN